ncbi:MAG TPA: glycosyltransferase [Bacteroidota bacterium]|nr:glycosyltransferase [Bacteroidota bacterium]
MTALLERYAAITGGDVVDKLRRLARPLRGMRVVHVNSTRAGGGVAEILHKLLPLLNELDIPTDWEIIEGDAEYYQCTKSFHNGLQGETVTIPDALLRHFEETNRRNAERLSDTLRDADVVFIHDPQPAPLLRMLPRRRGTWVWRCHIDVRRPYRPVWNYLRQWVADYDASIFSLSDFAQPLPHPQYLIPPSIDPLSEKNIDLEAGEIDAVYGRFGIDRARPMILQVSRYDRFKDPVGVIQAYRIAKRFVPGLQLVLAGGGADDDPEGEAVLREVHAAADGDDDVHVLLLPSDAHRVINALQRAADIVLQKSTREGFGLTVTEAMWKGKPVIGGNTGGIRLQVMNHHTGFLVSTPEGAALRIRYLLHNRERREHMGALAREFVRDNFLLTRHVGEYLTLMLLLKNGQDNRVLLR